jgi:hypothetical protein
MSGAKRGSVKVIGESPHERMEYEWNTNGIRMEYGDNRENEETSHRNKRKRGIRWKRRGRG